MTGPDGARTPALDLRVHGALLFVQVTFGALHVFGRHVLFHIEPMAVAAVRILVSAPLLVLIALRVDRRIPSPPDLARLALLGFLGVFSNQLLYIVGLKMTTATNAAILMPSIPVFVALVAAGTGLERLTWGRAAGVALAVVGALATLDFSAASLSGGTLVGNLLLLANCLVYAFYLVLQRPLFSRVHPVAIVAWAFLFGGAGVLAVSLPTLGRLDPAGVPSSAWLGLLYVAVIPTGVNYALNSWAMVRSSAGLVATYTTLQPLAAALMAALFLGERAGWREAFGFALIVAGLAVVTRSRAAAPARV